MWLIALHGGIKVTYPYVIGQTRVVLEGHIRGIQEWVILDYGIDYPLPFF